MKTILVKELYRLHGTASSTFSEDVSLEYVIAFLGQEPHIRGVFLMDITQRFSGVITSTDLIRWSHFQLFGGKGRREITESEFFRIVDANKAKDLVSRDYRDLGVKEEDSLQTALDKMLAYNEDVIPVLDSERHILGDLRLSEVLLKVLEVGKESQT